MTGAPDLWSRDALLSKAQVYIERASNVEAGSGLEALWSLLSLELLARAAVASVHPALLADPQDGAHLLYAFGHGEPRPPKSIPIASVFRRCRLVVPLFTEQSEKDGIALMTLRNEELHTGGLVLEELKSSSWQPQYYTICETLLTYLGLDLTDFFPAERAAAARTLLDALATDVESEVKQRVADVARSFKSLTPDEQETRKQTPVLVEGDPRQRRVPCPSCQSSALVSGEASDVSEPRVGEDQIERDIRILPTRFRCHVCGLALDGFAELHHAGLGDEYSVIDSEDPLDYYGIDPKDYVDISDFYEPDYGND